MIDVNAEELVLLKELPTKVPKRNGKRLNRATVYRWASRGIAKVRLETVYHAGQLYTSREALDRFDQAVTAAKRGPINEPKTDASKAHSRAEAKLRRVGL